MLDFYSASSQKLIHQVDMSLHSDTLLWFQDNQSLRWVLSGEAIKTNFIVCSLTQPKPESTIYRTRDEHANHYVTDTVFTYSLNKYCIVRTNCCFAFVCCCFYVLMGFWGYCANIVRSYYHILCFLKNRTNYELPQYANSILTSHRI